VGGVIFENASCECSQPPVSSVTTGSGTLSIYGRGTGPFANGVRITQGTQIVSNNGGLIDIRGTATGPTGGSSPNLQGSTGVLIDDGDVMATGASGIPNLPDIPSLKSFAGTVMHAHQYRDGDAWRGKRVLVIGTGNSGHDIAQDLHSAGAEVAIVQRSPTLIVNVEPSAQLPYALYDEGLSLEDCDLITVSFPLALARRSHKLITEQARKLDRELLAALERVGFRLDFGEDGTGWQFKYLTRGGGYYFNVGCSDLIAEGKIKLLQFSEIDAFVAEGARLSSGKTLGAELVVLATGYKGQEFLVRKLFGDEIAAKVGPIWGFGGGQELRNMFMRTPQPGLWFIAGSLATCRIYSKYLALQIKACEVGLLPTRRGVSGSEDRSRILAGAGSAH